MTVTVSDKLQFRLPVVGWMVDDGARSALLRGALICPIIPHTIGVLLESRIIPWRRSDQFWSYLPGNNFLAVYLAGTTWLVRELPAGQRFYCSKWFHAGALAASATTCTALTVLDFQGYRKSQMVSPMKMYHNSLYFWYLYLHIVMGAAALVSPASARRKALVHIPLALWVGCLIKDSFLMTPEEDKHKHEVAHIDGWQPLVTRKNWRALVASAREQFSRRTH